MSAIQKHLDVVITLLLWHVCSSDFRIKPTLKDLLVKIENWNKTIPLCQDLSGKVEFSLSFQFQAGQL